MADKPPGLRSSYAQAAESPGLALWRVTSYALAVEFYGIASERLHAAAATGPDDLDLFTAIVAGLCDQQVANDPGGQRWVRLSRRAMQMYFTDLDRHPRSAEPPSRKASS